MVEVVERAALHRHEVRDVVEQVLQIRYETVYLQPNSSIKCVEYIYFKKLYSNLICWGIFEICFFRKKNFEFVEHFSLLGFAYNICL